MTASILPVDADVVPMNLPNRGALSTMICQLWTLFRRNLLLKRRSLRITITEIALAGVFLGLLGLFGGLSSTRSVANPHTWAFPDSFDDHVEQPFEYPTTFEAMRWAGLYDNYTTSDDGLFRVGCTPDTSATRILMAHAAEYWSAMAQTSSTRNASTLSTKFYNSEADLETAYLDLSTVNMGLGLVFANGSVETLKYKIRSPSNLNYDSLVPGTERPYIVSSDLRACQPSRNTTQLDQRKCSAETYMLSGFTALQNVVAAAYTRIHFNITSQRAMTLSIRALPLPPAKHSHFTPLDPFAIIPAFLISNMLSLFAVFLVICIVTEKEQKHVASLKLMGLRPMVYGLSWIIVYLALIVAVSLIALAITKFTHIYPHSDYFAILNNCLGFGVGVIAIGFCISSLVKSPLVAGFVTYAVIQFLGGLGLLELYFPNMPESIKWILTLFTPAAFIMSLTRVGQAEAKGYGIGWDNGQDPASAYQSSFTFFAASMMLLADANIYPPLATYLNKVFRSDGSPSEVPWFFLLPSFWCGSNRTMESRDNALFDSPDIEQVSDEMRSRVAISINGLRKVFPDAKRQAAVHGFAYNIHDDEILAIVGHSGAGKTTLINMLTGILAPTSGTASVHGKEITRSDELVMVRRMIGVCPQHDVLLDTFTVRENIDFHARFKGFSADQAKIEFERTIDQIGMRAQSDIQAQNLSSGEKRRLSVAIAVIGNPKVLILDEPTYGVDAASCGLLWDLIRGLRKGRCIIITTHSIQEADDLADRTLIMSRGKLRCAGTSRFLKNRFGLGYQLTMSVDRTCDETQVEQFVLSRIGGAYKSPANSSSGQISFVLPMSRVADFPGLFSDLDSNLSKLNIDTYGISTGSVEEIFLRLSAEEVTDGVSGGCSNQGMEMIQVEPKRTAGSQLLKALFTPAIKGEVTSWTKFRALVKIRFLLLLRSKTSLALGFLIPLLLVLTDGAISLAVHIPVHYPFAGLPALNLNDLTADFHRTGRKFFYSVEAGNSDFTRIVEELTKLSNPFEHVAYSDLLQQKPHYLGFAFRNAAGADGAMDAATIYFNGSAHHSISYATNLLLNAVFRLHTNSEEVFSVSSQAFPPRNLASDTHSPHKTFIPTSFLVAISLVVISGVYGINVFRDRQLEIRSQIRTTGCSAVVYWGSAFASHLTHFAVCFAMVTVVLFAFKVTAVTDAFGCVVFLFALHAPAMILFSYCSSFLFAKQEMATIGLPFSLQVAGLASFTVVQLVDMFMHDEGRTTTVIHCIFAFALPFYGFFGGMLFVDKVGLANSYLELGQQPASYYDWNSSIPILFVAHAVHIPLLILLLAYLESNQIGSQFFGSSNQLGSSMPGCRPGVEPDESDLDVENERKTVSELNSQTDTTFPVLVRSLRKSFGKPVKPDGERSLAPAVKDLSLHLKTGEILGLVGPNGAGKSTILSMITGETTPWGGEVHVNGFHMYSQRERATEYMSVCPQTDTLWPDITVQGHLELFACLNDIPPQRSREAVQVLCEALNLTQHTQKKTTDLSPGTKRKLTFIISMLGNRPLLLLDNPFVGLDPDSKEAMRSIIRQRVGQARGAMLCTHSIAEAGDLCERIGVIVNGELQCLNSTRHLTDKSGLEYILEVKLGFGRNSKEQDGNENAAERAKSQIGLAVPGAVFVQRIYNRLVFSVPKDHLASVGAVFASLDRVHQLLDFEEYSFGPATVELPFHHYTNVREGVREISTAAI